MFGAASDITSLDLAGGFALQSTSKGLESAPYLQHSFFLLTGHILSRSMSNRIGFWP